MFVAFLRCFGSYDCHLGQAFLEKEIVILMGLPGKIKVIIS